MSKYTCNLDSKKYITCINNDTLFDKTYIGGIRPKDNIPLDWDCNNWWASMIGLQTPNAIELKIII